MTIQRTFSYDDETKFLKIFQQALGGLDLPSFVRFELNDKSLFVKVEKNGMSAIHLSIQKKGSAMIIQEKERKVALLHRPFIHRATSMLEDLFDQVSQEIRNG